MVASCESVCRPPHIGNTIAHSLRLPLRQLASELLSLSLSLSLFLNLSFYLCLNNSSLFFSYKFLLLLLQILAATKPNTRDGNFYQSFWPQIYTQKNPPLAVSQLPLAISVCDMSNILFHQTKPTSFNQSSQYAVLTNTQFLEVLLRQSIFCFKSSRVHVQKVQK